MFSVSDIDNVGYKDYKNDKISVTLKINKYGKVDINTNPGKIKQSFLRSNSVSDNKENIHPNQVEVVEFGFDSENSSFKVSSRRTDTKNAEDYDVEEIEEGPRFSKSRARKRSSSLITKKTPRNSSSTKDINSNRGPSIAINSIINKRLQGLDKVLRPPSSQRAKRNYYSNFSLKSSN